MNKKTIATLCLALAVLAVVPGSQASADPAVATDAARGPEAVHALNTATPTKVNCAPKFVALAEPGVADVALARPGVADSAVDSPAAVETNIGCGGGTPTPPGCTTVFVSSEGSTVGTYVYRAYNEPVSVSNVVSWHLGLALGTTSNTLAFVNCVV